MTSLLVGTRKGLFVIDNNQIKSHHFQGEPVSQVLIVPRSQAWLVALNLGHFGIKLHKSVDQGKTWTALPAPAFPIKPVEGDADFAAYEDDPTPWNVELIWSLATGGVDEPDTLWAGCIPAGVRLKTRRPLSPPRSRRGWASNATSSAAATGWRWSFMTIHWTG